MLYLKSPYFQYNVDFCVRNKNNLIASIPVIPALKYMLFL